MASNRGARLLLVVGFLAAWIGYDAWLVSHVVLDPNATRAAAHALVETPAVRHRLAHDLTKELERQLPAAAKDSHVSAAAATAVRDPRVSAAFADTVSHIRQAILSHGDGGTETFGVDGAALRAALHDALAPVDPQLAARVERLPPLEVRLESTNLTHVHDPGPALGVVALLGLTAAVLLVAASLLLEHDRRSIALAGRRTAYLAATPLAAFVVLPRVLSLSSADAPQIASALLREYGDRALPSAIALAVVGLAVVAGTVVWGRRGTTRPARNPARPQPELTAWPRPQVATDQTTMSETTSG
jgi:hypothetical protein